MDTLFDQVFNLASDPRLQEWGMKFIMRMADSTEEMVNAELNK